MTIFFFKELKEGFSGPYASWAETKVLIKKMLSYSWPILVLGIAGILNQTATRFSSLTSMRREMLTPSSESMVPHRRLR